MCSTISCCSTDSERSNDRGAVRCGSGRPSATEREMLLGWRDAVEGMFEVERREATS